MRSPRSANRPLWAGYLATAFAAVGGLGLADRALAGDNTVLGIPSLAWPGAAVLLGGAVAAAVSVGHPTHRFTVHGVGLALGAVAALSTIGSCFVLLGLIELALTGSVTDPAGNSDWTAFGERLGAVLLATLFAAATSSWRRRTSGRCTRCGESHSPERTFVVHPAARAAGPTVCLTVYAGCAAFVPYLTFHGLHAAGRLPSHNALYADSGISPILHFAALATGMVGPAVFLALGLVQRWGMRFPWWVPWLAGHRVPRALPLAPVWLIAPTLTLYGIGGFGYAIAEGHSLWGLGGAASLAFGGYGCALTVAAVSYLRRSRPRCADSPNRPPVGRSSSVGAPINGSRPPEVEAA